jgi:4-hydroxy-3-polyprenylbenzoate decarboxylase
MGVSLCAAMPGFYQQPSEILDLVDMMVMKILDQMQLPVDLVGRWKAKPEETHQAKLYEL